MNALWYKKFYERLAASYQFGGQTAVEQAEEMLHRIETADSLDADARDVAALLGKTQNRSQVVAALRDLCEHNEAVACTQDDRVLSDSKDTGVLPQIQPVRAAEGGGQSEQASTGKLKTLLDDLAQILHLDATDADLQLNVLGAVEYLAGENQRYQETCKTLCQLAGCRLDSELPDAFSRAFAGLKAEEPPHSLHDNQPRDGAILAIKAQVGAEMQALKAQVRAVAGFCDKLRHFNAAECAAAECLQIAGNIAGARVYQATLLPVSRRLAAIQARAGALAQKLDTCEAGQQTTELEASGHENWQIQEHALQQQQIFIAEQLSAISADFGGFQAQIRLARSEIECALQDFGSNVFACTTRIAEAAAFNRLALVSKAMQTSDDGIIAQTQLVARLQKQLLRQNSEFMQIRHILAVGDAQDVIPRVIELVSACSNGAACLMQQSTEEVQTDFLHHEKFMQTNANLGNSAATQTESQLDINVDRLALRAAVESARELLGEIADSDSIAAVENRLLVLQKHVQQIDIAVQSQCVQLQESAAARLKALESTGLKAQVLRLEAENLKLQTMYSKCSQQLLRATQVDSAGLRAENVRLQRRCAEFEEVLAVYEQQDVFSKACREQNGVQAENQALKQQNSVLERQLKALKGSGLSAKQILLLRDVVAQLKAIFQVESDAALVESAMRAYKKRPR